MNLLTQHLLRLGHRRIGLLSWEKYQDVKNFCRQNRVAAFQKAMRKYGLPDNLLSGMQWSREMDLALHRLLKQNVTAIITTAEGDEYRALYHLKQFGLNVPDDLSLAGWLHPEFSRFCDPPITGIEQNYRFLAQHAVALFNRLLHKESVAGDVLLDYNFFERCTTAPPGEYKKFLQGDPKLFLQFAAQIQQIRMIYFKGEFAVFSFRGETNQLFRVSLFVGTRRAPTVNLKIYCAGEIMRKGKNRYRVSLAKNGFRTSTGCPDSVAEIRQLRTAVSVGTKMGRVKVSHLSLCKRNCFCTLLVRLFRK